MAFTAPNLQTLRIARYGSSSITKQRGSRQTVPYELYRAVVLVDLAAMSSSSCRTERPLVHCNSEKSSASLFQVKLFRKVALGLYCPACTGAPAAAVARA